MDMMAQKSNNGDENSFDTVTLNQCLVDYKATDDTPASMPYNLVRNYIKPRRERPNPFKANPLCSRPNTPSIEKICSFPSPPKGMETCEYNLQGENKHQSNINEKTLTVAKTHFEIGNTSPKPTLLLDKPLELADPPNILSAVEAKSLVQGLIKPTPVVLSLPQKLQIDLNNEQFQFVTLIESYNAIMLEDIRTKQLHLMKKDISHKSSTEVDKHLVSLPSTPGLITSTREQTEERKVTNTHFHENNLTTEIISPSKPTESETVSYAFNAPQEVCLKQPESTIKQNKIVNYVMVTAQENKSTKSINEPDKTEYQPSIKEIPMNDSITVGKMQVSKYGVYDCINLLLGVLDVFENKELLLMSETACAIPQVNVEKNIMACINTLVSFSEDHHEQENLRIRANKGNIFVGAKEKYSAMFDSKNKKAHKQLSRDLESELLKPLPIMVPDHTMNRSTCPNPKTKKKDVSTQVKCSDNVMEKRIPIPKIIVTKPKCPTPIPSPYPSPKFNGKYKRGLKHYGSSIFKPNSDLATQLNEVKENLTTGTQSPQPQDSAKSKGSEEMVNSHQTNKTTPVYLNNESFTEHDDSRLNKSSLSTFSPKVSKRVKQFIKFPATKIELQDNSDSPYEPPKSIMPSGMTKAFSTSNLKNFGQAIPSYGEVETLSINSITTVTDDIVFTDLTERNNNSRAKQRAANDSPIYWISNHPQTDVKLSTFRTFISKVAKPFRKSPNLEKKDVSSKRLEVKPESDKSADKYETKTSGLEPLDGASKKGQIAASVLKIPSVEECKRRNRNFQSWLDAQNQKLLAKQHQSSLSTNTPNIENETFV